MKPKLIVFDTLPTTMLEARARARGGAPEGTTILALAQTSARGRHGRKWLAEPNTGVWMTMILRPPPARCESFAELSLVAGVAVCKSVRDLGAEGAMLKWPNDVVVGERKLAGILLESDAVAGGQPASDCVLVGIGLNLTPRAERTLPAEIDAIYTGLFEHIPQAGFGVPAEPNLPAPVYGAYTLMRQLATWYDFWQAHGFAGITATYGELDALNDCDVRVAATDGTAVAGKARGVNAQGELLVETERGVAQIRAGEVERVRR